MKAAILVVVLLILTCPVKVAAQRTGEENRQGQGQTTTEKPVKEPPPPLFPKHRRGMYTNRNDMPLLDATPQSPPLEIDDPGVPDKGEYEINFTTHADLSESVKEFDLLLVDANYGMLHRVLGHDLPTQLKFEFPVAGSKENGQPFTAGVGTFRVGLKFNFYNNEHKGASVSFYPQIEFAAAGTRAVEKGLADAGQTVTLPLLVQKELSQVTLVVNGVVRQPIHDPDRTTTGRLSIGVGRAMTRQLVLMAEARLESAFDLQRDRLVALNVGVMRGVGETLVVYANMGRSLFADGGIAHTFVGVGLKVLTRSKDKKAARL
jgi:hypothetical protein